MEVRLNLNDRIKVKLTPLGHDRHRLFHDSCTPHRPYHPVKQDKDGWSTWQVWSLFQVFGEHLGCGAPLVFEAEMRIVD